MEALVNFQFLLPPSLPFKPVSLFFVTYLLYSKNNPNKSFFNPIKYISTSFYHNSIICFFKYILFSFKRSKFIFFTVQFTEEERESARKTALQLSKNKKTPYTDKGITVLSAGVIHTVSANFNSSTTIFPVGYRSMKTHPGEYLSERERASRNGSTVVIVTVIFIS